MNAILMVSLSGFYTNSLPTPERPEVCRVVHREGVVLDVCPRGASKGVAQGTALSEAKAVLREECVYTEFVEAEFAAARNEWLDVLLAYCDTVESSIPHQAFLDLGDHPDPRDIASTLLRSLAERFPCYGLSAGLGPAKWVAEVVLAPIDTSALCLGLPVLEPVTDVMEFIDQIPTSLLLPVPSEHRARLEYLGYRWARLVASAPLSVLRDQFGKDSFLIHECSRGRLLDKVEPNYPGSVLVERAAFGHAVDSSLVLEEAITSLCAEIAAKLSSTDTTASGLRLIFEQSEGAPLTVSRSFPRPVQAATPLRVATCALWKQSKLAFAPIGVRIVMSGLQKAPRGQKSFMGLESAHERSRSCDVTVRCLKAAFGEAVVLPASSLSVPRRELLLRVWKRATGWR